MRARRPKTRRHLAYAMVEVKRFPNGILSALPIVKREPRLVNWGKDYSKAANNTTSRCLRVQREAAAIVAMPARERGKSLLEKMGSAIVGRITKVRVEDGVATRLEG